MPLLRKGIVKKNHLLKTSTKTSSWSSPAAHSTCQWLKYVFPSPAPCAAPEMSRATSPQPTKPHQQEQTADADEKQPEVERGGWQQTPQTPAGSSPFGSTAELSLLCICQANSKHTPELHQERARS